MEINIANIKEQIWVMLAFVFLSTICSSFLFIFLFNFPLFDKTDLIKLLLLSVSITLPILLINALMASFITYTATSDNENNGLKIVPTIVLASVLTYPVFYIPIIIKLFWVINMREGAIIGLSIEIAIITISIIGSYLNDKKKERDIRKMVKTVNVTSKQKNKVNGAIQKGTTN